jgi:hypothetical protein
MDLLTTYHSNEDNSQLVTWPFEFRQQLTSGLFVEFKKRGKGRKNNRVVWKPQGSAS